MKRLIIVWKFFRSLFFPPDHIFADEIKNGE